MTLGQKNPEDPEQVAENSVYLSDEEGTTSGR